MTTDRIHFECVLHLPVGRRIIHEYAPGEAEAREQAWATVHQMELEVLSIDLNVIPTPPPPYELECYSCGLLGTNEHFGFGGNRQCPSCGSYEVHSPSAYVNADTGAVLSNEPYFTAENGAITGPVNVALQMPDNGYLNVRVTHEGVIFDAYINGALVGTRAALFTETFDSLTERTN